MRQLQHPRLVPVPADDLQPNRQLLRREAAARTFFLPALPADPNAVPGHDQELVQLIGVASEDVLKPLDLVARGA